MHVSIGHSQEVLLKDGASIPTSPNLFVCKFSYRVREVATRAGAMKAQLVQLLHAFGSRRSSDKELEHRICRSTCPDP